MPLFISFGQNVSNTVDDYFERGNTYLPEIYVNNEIVSWEIVCDSISVARTEGQGATANFTIVPGTGLQNFENYLGQTVFINMRSTSSVTRIFTGYIDNYTIDFIEQKCRFDCTDRRNTAINNLSSNIIQQIGQYSRFVFGYAIDKSDELNKRLSTVPGSFDFDAVGNPKYTPWAPKTTADYVLTDSNIYYDQPKVVYGDPSKALNTINISITYQYQRLHQQVAQCTWQGYADFLQNWFNEGKPSFPTRAMIESAANATSWTVLRNINFVSLWEAGGYGGVVWQPNQVSYTYAKKQASQPLYYEDPDTGALSLVWPDGNRYSASYDIVDANNQPIYEIASTITVDTSSNLCRGAQWLAAKKFSQTINELYSIKITSPQAINKFGAVTKYESVSVNDPYDTSGWERSRTNYTPGTRESFVIGDIIIDDAGYDEGTISFDLSSSGSGVLYAGTQFTIDGEPSGQVYTVANNLTLGGSGPLKILYPGLASELEAGTPYTITILPSSVTYSANMFFNKYSHRDWLVESIAVSCKKAEVAIRAAHRNVYVKFKRSMWPEIDLQHTVEITGDNINCKGKVYKINHFVDANSGEMYTNIELLLTRSFGSDNQSVYSVSIPPYEDVTYIGLPTQITLQTHLGEDPDPTNNPISVNWSGYIGNKESSSVTRQRTTYQESFVVDYPTLPTSLTALKTITNNTPGNASGVTTNNAGYAQGVTTINLAAGGTGSIKQGDTITITGDSSGQVYVVQSDILDVSAGGVLNIQPGLQATLATTTYPIVVSQPANQFTIQIESDPLTITFPSS